MTEQRSLLVIETAAMQSRKNTADFRLELFTADDHPSDLSPLARAFLDTVGRIAEVETRIDKMQEKIADQGVTPMFAFGELVAQPATAAARIVCQAVASMVSGDEIKDHFLRKVELTETWRAFRESDNAKRIVPHVRSNERRLVVRHQALAATMVQMEADRLIRVAPDGSIVSLASSDEQEESIITIIDASEMVNRQLQMHQSKPTALTIATRRSQAFVAEARNDARKWGADESDISGAIKLGKTRSETLLKSD